MFVIHFISRGMLARACAGWLLCLLAIQSAWTQGPGGITPPSMKGPEKKARDNSPQFAPVGPQILITDVRITGNAAVPENKVFSYIKTRSGRAYDPEVVQADVRSLAGSGLFRDVRTYTEDTPQGRVVTFQVFERATIGYIRFVGNYLITDKGLLKQIKLAPGDPLAPCSTEEARRKIEEHYHSKGFPHATVSIFEGNRPEDRGVTFLIGEGELQRIWDIQIVGNTLATDERLRTLIKSKTFYKSLNLGQFDRRMLDEDVDRLTAYYRSLGYFRARVGREIQAGDSGKWVSITFVIDEGPQYEIRNISFVGNKSYTAEQLSANLNLQAGEKFKLVEMNKDVNTLRDAYGSKGHVFADVKADPRFLEEPGKLDLVYQIEEGDVYRVGRIDVKIAGGASHTRRSVVLNRLSLRPGDLLDIREVRASERRLKASQLFKAEPQSGIEPRIVVKPPNGDIDIVAEAPRSASPPAGNVRGQSPDAAWPMPAVRPVVLEVEIDASQVDALERSGVLDSYTPANE